MSEGHERLSGKRGMAEWGEKEGFCQFILIYECTICFFFTSCMFCNLSLKKSMFFRKFFSDYTFLN